MGIDRVRSERLLSPEEVKSIGHLHFRTLKARHGHPTTSQAVSMPESRLMAWIRSGWPVFAAPSNPGMLPSITTASATPLPVSRALGASSPWPSAPRWLVRRSAEGNKSDRRRLDS